MYIYINEYTNTMYKNVIIFKENKDKSKNIYIFF